MHELYCAGHLIEAAVAYQQATGKRKLLDVAITTWLISSAKPLGPARSWMPPAIRKSNWLW